MKTVESIRETQKTYCSRAMVIAIVAALILILAGYKPIGKGLVLGTLFSILNFILIAETLPMRLGKSKSATFLVNLGSIALRYLLLGIPLVIALKSDSIHLAGAIVGIFMLQLVILGDHLRPARSTK